MFAIDYDCGISPSTHATVASSSADCHLLSPNCHGRFVGPLFPAGELAFGQ